MESNPEAVRQLTIEQLVATAGDGRLRDGTDSQHELRAFLQRVQVEELAPYADYCLRNSFPKSGQVLQDIVNELGRRLEYDVTNGRYQGTTNAVGFDGIWHDPAGHWIVVEVKTTDVYRLSLDTLTKYRSQLLEQGQLSQPSSILIIVGRADTGELEAQVRGSKHAWDIRLISVDSLINLVHIKENADGHETIAKIRKLLTPLEYTRLDELVDVVFTTAQDVETSVSTESMPLPVAEENSIEESTARSWEFTPSAVIQEIREKILFSLGLKLGVNFIKKSRALYWNSEHTHRVACTISKLYNNQGLTKYWYAYHPQWHNFIREEGNGFLVLGCSDINTAFALPYDVINAHLEEMHTTEKRDGTGVYYHLKIVNNGDANYALQLPKSGGLLALGPWEITFNPESVSPF
jgi:hypothetical protein